MCPTRSPSGGKAPADVVLFVFVFAISRYRVYVADADAATAVGSGEPLARALEKIDQKRSSLQRAFATHPPTEKRIQRLRSGY